MNDIILTAVTDKHYAMPLTVMVHSAMKHLAPNRAMLLIIIAADLSDADKSKMLDSWEPWGGRLLPLFFYSSVKPYIEAKLNPMHWQKEAFWGTYLKTEIPERLGETNKAIYLDSDMLVLHDLSELWDMSCEHTLACRDLFSTRHFNAGMFVANLIKWREEDIAERALLRIKKLRGRTTAWDQDGWNYVLAGKWAELDPRWNQQSSDPLWRSWDAGSSEYPYIVHYCLPDKKPWRQCKREHPLAGLWRQYRDETAWSEKREPVAVA